MNKERIVDVQIILNGIDIVDDFRDLDDAQVLEEFITYYNVTRKDFNLRMIKE